MRTACGSCENSVKSTRGAYGSGESQWNGWGGRAGGAQKTEPSWGGGYDGRKKLKFESFLNKKWIENRQATKIRFWATGGGRAREWWKFDESNEGRAREWWKFDEIDEGRAREWWKFNEIDEGRACKWWKFDEIGEGRAWEWWNSMKLMKGACGRCAENEAVMRGRVRWPKKIKVLIVFKKEINRKPPGSQNQILSDWRGARLWVVKIRRNRRGGRAGGPSKELQRWSPR